MGVIDTVYNIGDKLDCSCSIGSPDGRLFCCVGGLICCIVGLICWIVGLTVGSCKVVIGVVAPGVGTPLQSLNRFNAAVMSRFMSAIIDVTFMLARIAVSLLQVLNHRLHLLLILYRLFVRLFQLELMELLLCQ